MAPCLTRQGAGMFVLLVLLAIASVSVKSQDASVLHRGKTFRPIRVTLRSDISGSFLRLSRSRTFFNAGGKRCNAKAMFVLTPYGINGTVAFTIRTLRKRRYLQAAHECSISSVKSVKALKSIDVSDPGFFFIPAHATPSGVQFESLQYRGNTLGVIATQTSASLLALMCERNSSAPSPSAHVFKLGDVSRGCPNIKPLNLSSILLPADQTTGNGVSGSELTSPTKVPWPSTEAASSAVPPEASGSTSQSLAEYNASNPATSGPRTLSPVAMARLKAYLKKAAQQAPAAVAARSRVSPTTRPPQTSAGVPQRHRALPHQVDRGTRAPTSEQPRSQTVNLAWLAEMLRRAALARPKRHKRDTAADQQAVYRDGVVMSNDNELRASDIDAIWGLEPTDASGDQEADEFDFHLNYTNAVEYSSEGSKGIPQIVAGSDRDEEFVPYVDEYVDVEKSELQADCDNADLVYIQLRSVGAEHVGGSERVHPAAASLVMAREDPVAVPCASQARVVIPETEPPRAQALPPAHTSMKPELGASPSPSDALPTVAAVTDGTQTTSPGRVPRLTTSISPTTAGPPPTEVPIVTVTEFDSLYAYMMAILQRLFEEADADHAPSPIH